MKTNSKRIAQLVSRVLFLTTVSGMLLFVSCSKDDPIPQPTPTDNGTTLLFKSSEIVEFKQIQSEGIEQDIPKEDIESYFGKRIQLNCPDTLCFKGDSLFLSRKNGLNEKYEIKWNNNKLYLHNAIAESWEYAGKKINDKKFQLNTGFYFKKEANNQRSLTISGREYSIESYQELTTYFGKLNQDSSSKLIWLKISYLFE